MSLEYRKGEPDFNHEGVHYAPSAEMLSRKNMNILPQTLLSGRIPPQALEMEQVVLGAILGDGLVALDKVAGFLLADHFYKEGHRLIYEAVVSMNSTDSPVNLFTVGNHLRSTGMLEAVGGIYYMTELTEKGASAANIEYHARVIQEKWVKRAMVRICHDGINRAYDETQDTFELHSALLKEIEDLEPRSDELVNGMDLIPVIAKEVQDAISGKSPSIKFGFRDMDGDYAFDFGEYVVIAGDSGTGKTTFAMQVAKRMRKEYKDVPILFNARDMAGKKVVARDLASEMEMSQMRFRTGKGMDVSHFTDMNELACAYDGIYFCSEFTAAALRAHCRKLKKRLGLAPKAGIVIMNDYLQLGDGEGSSREQQVGSISLDDKKIATRQNALVIDLSQVNESAGKARPNHKSIRESRAPYHHADWVIFLYSPSRNGEERYEDGSSTEGIIEAILDKVRCGRPGNVIKLCMTQHGLITDLPDNQYDIPFPDPKRVQPKDYTIPSHDPQQPEEYEIGGRGAGNDFSPF